MVPLQVRHRLDVARQHLDSGSRQYAEMIDRELLDGRRLVPVGEGIVAFQAFAAAAPFETWMIPINMSVPEQTAATLRAALEAAGT